MNLEELNSFQKTLNLSPGQRLSKAILDGYFEENQRPFNDSEIRILKSRVKELSERIAERQADHHAEYTRIKARAKDQRTADRELQVVQNWENGPGQRLKEAIEADNRELAALEAAQDAHYARIEEADRAEARRLEKDYVAKLKSLPKAEDLAGTITEVCREALATDQSIQQIITHLARVAMTFEGLHVEREWLQEFKNIIVPEPPAPLITMDQVGALHAEALSLVGKPFDLPPDDYDNRRRAAELLGRKRERAAARILAGR